MRRPSIDQGLASSPAPPKPAYGSGTAPTPPKPAYGPGSAPAPPRAQDPRFDDPLTKRVPDPRFEDPLARQNTVRVPDPVAAAPVRSPQNTLKKQPPNARGGFPPARKPSVDVGGGGYGGLGPAPGPLSPPRRQEPQRQEPEIVSPRQPLGPRPSVRGAGLPSGPRGGGGLPGGPRPRRG